MPKRTYCDTERATALAVLDANTQPNTYTQTHKHTHTQQHTSASPTHTTATTHTHTHTHKRVTQEELEATRDRQEELKAQIERCQRLLERSRTWVGFRPEPFREALSCSNHKAFPFSLNPLLGLALLGAWTLTAPRTPLLAAFARGGFRAMTSGIDGEGSRFATAPDACFAR